METHWEMSVACVWHLQANKPVALVMRFLLALHEIIACRNVLCRKRFSEEFGVNLYRMKASFYFFFFFVLGSPWSLLQDAVSLKDFFKYPSPQS